MNIKLNQTYNSTLLKLALPTQGELSGTWGTVINENITNMVEEAVAGLKTINTWSGWQTLYLIRLACPMKH